MSLNAQAVLVALALAVGVAAIAAGATWVGRAGVFVVVAGVVTVVGATLALTALVRRAARFAQPTPQSRPSAWTMAVIALAAASLGGTLTVIGGVLGSAALLGLGLATVCAAVACIGVAHGELSAMRMDLSAGSQAGNARALTGLLVARTLLLIGATTALIVFLLPGFPVPALAAALACVFFAAYVYLRFRSNTLLKVAGARAVAPDQPPETTTP